MLTRLSIPYRAALLVVAVAVALSLIIFPLQARAVGDAKMDTYLIADPLSGGTEVSTATLLTAASATTETEDSVLDGLAYAETSADGWTAPGEEVIDVLVGFTTEIPSDSLASALTSICPTDSTTTTTTTTTIPNDQIPGDAEVACNNATTGALDVGIAWISGGNVLALIETIGVPQTTAESIAYQQYMALPTAGVTLAANTSYVIKSFAKNSATLTTAMKLSIANDAGLINNMNPTSISWNEYQASAGKATVTKALANKRVAAVYAYFVKSLKTLGMSSATLDSLKLNQAHAFVTSLKKVSATQSATVGLQVDYLQ